MIDRGEGIGDRGVGASDGVHRRPRSQQTSRLLLLLLRTHRQRRMLPGLLCACGTVPAEGAPRVDTKGLHICQARAPAECRTPGTYTRTRGRHQRKRGRHGGNSERGSGNKRLNLGPVCADERNKSRVERLANRGRIVGAWLHKLRASASDTSCTGPGAGTGTGASAGACSGRRRKRAQGRDSVGGGGGGGGLVNGQAQTQKGLDSSRHDGILRGRETSGSGGSSWAWTSPGACTGGSDKERGKHWRWAWCAGACGGGDGGGCCPFFGDGAGSGSGGGSSGGGRNGRGVGCSSSGSFGVGGSARGASIKSESR
jgi:hypothetical protein